MNKLTKHGNRIVKSFGNRMDYVRELSIYEKLAGTGLAPEMTAHWDGNIEHEYIEGIPFDEIMRVAKSDEQRFKFCADKFFEWYKQYREITNISMGDIDFDDFIVKDEKLICIDFEQCCPGYAEDDIAKLAAQVAILPSGYTPEGLRNAIIFVGESYSVLELVQERLYLSIKESLEKLCKEKGITNMPAADEYIATAVTCDYSRINPSAKIDGMIEALSKNKKLWTLFQDVNKKIPRKFLRYMMGADKEGYQAIYLTEHQSLVVLPLLVRTEDMLSILQLAKQSDLNLRDILILKAKSRGITAESMIGYEPGIL